MITTVQLPESVRLLLRQSGDGRVLGGDSRVFVQFALATRSFSVRQTGESAWRRHEDAELRTVLVSPRDAAASDEALPLQVTADHESPRVVSIVFAVDQRRSAIVYPDPPESAAVEAAGAVGESDTRDPFALGGQIRFVLGPPEAFLFAAPDYIEEMERLLAVARPGQHERRFFFGLDRRTNPGLIGDSEEGRRGVEYMQMSLGDRVTAWKNGSGAGRPSTQHYHLNAWQQVLGQSFALMEPLLTDLGKSADDAMDYFANGSLRLRLTNGEWTTEPSSGFFFLFGEVALLGVDFRDEALWLPFARASIRAQEIFAPVYRNRSNHPDPYAGYSADAFHPDRQRTTTEQQALRVKYDEMDLNALQEQAAENARRLLFGE